MTDLSEQALKECQVLLASARLTLRRGLYLQGELTSVTLLVQPDLEDAAFRRVRVMCHSAGQLKVDWERVGFWLRDAETKETLNAVVLDARGQSAMLRVRYSDARKLEFLDPAFSLSPSFSYEDLFSLAAPVGSETPFSLTGLSGDERLEAQASLLPDRSLHVKVRARHDSLRGATVVIEIRLKRTQEVLYSATFSLRFEDGRLGDWVVKDELSVLPAQEEFELFIRPVFERES